MKESRSVVARDWGQVEERIQEAGGNFWGNRYVYYLGCGYFVVYTSVKPY